MYYVIKKYKTCLLPAPDPDPLPEPDPPAGLAPVFINIMCYKNVSGKY